MTIMAQTTRPFKPSCSSSTFAPPHYFWLCSRSFSFSSRKAAATAALHRREDCKSLNAKIPFSNASVVHDSVKFEHKSSYSTMQFEDSRTSDLGPYKSWLEEAEVFRKEKKSRGFSINTAMKNGLPEKITAHLGALPGDGSVYQNLQTSPPVRGSTPIHVYREFERMPVKSVDCPTLPQLPPSRGPELGRVSSKNILREVKERRYPVHEGDVTDAIRKSNYEEYITPNNINGTPSTKVFGNVKASSQMDICKRLSHIYDKVLVVDNISAAEKVVSLLTNQYKHLIYACDTEVAKIDVKEETPVDHGEIICFSIYAGPEADFGNGKSCVWVDVLDGGGKDLLEKFLPFFENRDIRKVDWLTVGRLLAFAIGYICLFVSF